MQESNQTSGPDTAAELTRLAGWISDQLADETADRQWIAESAAAKVRDITLQMLGAAELARRERRAVSGPFETEPLDLPAVQAVYAAFRADPGAGHMDAHNARLITSACDAAGVTLGAYDRRIVAWLAGFEPQTCAVVAGLVSRAAVPALTPQQLAVLAQALGDAVTYRDPSGACPDCNQHPAGLCEDHAADLDKSDAYLALARALGIEL